MLYKKQVTGTKNIKIKLGQMIEIHMFAYLIILLIYPAFVILSQQTLLAQFQSGLIPIIASKPLIQEFAVPTGSQPHDVAPACMKNFWR